MATRGWETVTPADLQQLQPAPKPRKYRNVKVVIDGITFDSRAEGDVYLKLCDRQARGEIYDLRRQVHFPLCTAIVGRAGGGWLQAIVAHYVADFVYVEAGVQHVVDVKRRATQTAVYKLKRKWLAIQNGITIEEVAG